ncbi:hypothetical protein PB1_05682 [Bacillus methanolicus PB1]|uniref:Uncharacterized protein n=1 Tax=Bacillus methanolicus PB1 TaxID=997296 RepID=I3E010_BACMT|nr:hypothetical protein PB1_05682 [Bacillus methanolicus PB1]
MTLFNPPESFLKSILKPGNARIWFEKGRNNKIYSPKFVKIL